MGYLFIPGCDCCTTHTWGDGTGGGCCACVADLGSETPDTWTVVASGFTDGTHVHCSRFNGTWTLTRTGTPCVWQVTSSTVTITLTASGSDLQVTFSDTESGFTCPITYALGATPSCTGANTLSYSPPDPVPAGCLGCGHPATVTATPGGDTTDEGVICQSLNCACGASNGSLFQITCASGWPAGHSIALGWIGDDGVCGLWGSNQLYLVAGGAVPPPPWAVCPANTFAIRLIIQLHSVLGDGTCNNWRLGGSYDCMDRGLNILSSCNPGVGGAPGQRTPQAGCTCSPLNVVFPTAGAGDCLGASNWTLTH